MDNRNIIILIIFILMIYILYCQNICNTQENFNSKNIDHFTDNVTINEAIKNVSLLSRELMKGDNLTLPSNLILDGDTNGVLLHSIILWSDNNPPFPNTNPITRNGHELSYTLNSTDCWYPCIGGTINVDGVDINIPDMKGRMIVGFGATNNSSNVVHQFLDNPGTNVGGSLPLRPHGHTGGTNRNSFNPTIERCTDFGIFGESCTTTIDLGARLRRTREKKHKHIIPVSNDDSYINDFNNERCPNSDDCRVVRRRKMRFFGGDITNDYLTGNTLDRSISMGSSDGDHSHNVTVQHTSHNDGTDNYTRNSVPHSIVLEYWMRIR